MEGGSYYKSFLNPHSGWSEAGYYTGLAVAEVTKQVALYFATEGAFALMSRGLGLGARAVSAEARLGEEVLASEATGARTARGAFGMGTDVAELGMARAAGSSESRIATTAGEGIAPNLERSF